MLTSKQRSYLRGLANNINPIFQVGKNGLSEAFYNQVSLALEKREIIKVKILKNNDDDIREIANEITKATKSESVQIIGSVIAFYKESKNNKVIELS